MTIEREKTQIINDVLDHLKIEIELTHKPDSGLSSGGSIIVKTKLTHEGDLVSESESSLSCYDIKNYINNETHY